MAFPKCQCQEKAYVSSARLRHGIPNPGALKLRKAIFGNPHARTRSDKQRYSNHAPFVVLNDTPNLKPTAQNLDPKPQLFNPGPEA